MNSTTICYHENALEIRLGTSSPESLHLLIMRGITTSLKNAIQAKENSQQEVEGLLTLADVLQKITPKENELEKAYKL
jgi:flagellin-specific chaperone FliS